MRYAKKQLSLWTMLIGFLLISGALASSVLADPADQTSEPTAQPTAEATASSGLTGLWAGILTQSGGGEPTDYYTFGLALTEQGGTVSGTSFITLLSAPRNYGSLTLNGTENGSGFSFQETQILPTSSVSNLCLKSGQLTQNQDKLTGTWQGDHDCGGGQISLVKISDDLSPLSTQNSTPFAGLWLGSLFQSGDSVSPAYPFALLLSQQGTTITGKSLVALPDSEDTGVMALNGSSNAQQLTFSETSILEQNGSDSTWCLKSGTLKEVSTGIMEGNWQGSGDCTPGTITLIQFTASANGMPEPSATAVVNGAST